MDTECEHGTRNGNRCEDCEALALLHAEIDRLRAAIERAPHDKHCVYFEISPANDCDCWKRAALEAER